MKIAYCFSGHLRTFNRNPSLLKYLLGPNPGDVFVHTYKMRNGGPRWHRDNSGDDVEVTPDDIGHIEKKYRPVALLIDEKQCGADHLVAEHARMGFRHSICRSNTLRVDHEESTETKYDVVFSARFDLLLQEPFVFPDKIDPETVYGSYNKNMEEKGYDGEVFTYASPDVMTAMTIPAIPAIVADKVPGYDFIGEALFTEVRKSHGFKYQAHSVPLGLLRSYGVLVVRT